MVRPRIFLSAVTSELRSAREIVARAVRVMGGEPVSQEDFPTGHGELRQWLREQIDSCQGLIQLVGNAYGEEPNTGGPDGSRVSYTQAELLYAKDHGKKIWVIVAGDGVPRDRLVDDLDRPADPAHPDPAGYQAERRALQRTYHDRLVKDNYLRHPANSIAELENIVLRIRDDVGLLRHQTQRQGRRLFRANVAILVALGLLIVAGGWYVWGAREIRVERIREHLYETIKQTHERDLAAAEDSKDWAEGERLRAAADAAHRARLLRIDDLATAFEEIEGRGSTTDVFQTLRRILNEQGVDQAIGYIEAQRLSVLERAKAARERTRTELRPLLVTATLRVAKGDVLGAKSDYSDVLALEPDWPEAVHATFWFLLDQGDAATYRTGLAAAAPYYEEAAQLARRFAERTPGDRDGQRDLAISFGKLGDLAIAQDKLVEARQSYERGMAVSQALVAIDPAQLTWQRDLAVSFGKIGDVASTQGSLSDAARAYGESLKITKQLLAKQPDNTDWQRDLANSYEDLGDLARAESRLNDAAKAYEDSLAIRKQLAARDPKNLMWQRDVAVGFGRVGRIAAAQDRLTDALPAFEEELRISKTLAAAEPANTLWKDDVSTAYERLGLVALRQKRFDDAHEAFANRLEIAKTLAAADPGNPEKQHDLALAHTRLGDLARDQGKFADAESAYRRGLVIIEKITARNPDNAERQRSLAVAHTNVGTAAFAQGKLTEAARAFEADLAITKTLVSAEPTNPSRQRDLAASYENVGELAERQKRTAESVAYWNQALKVFSTLEQRGQLLPEDRATINKLQKKVAAHRR